MPRLAGFFYLLVFVTGALAVPAGHLVIPGDAAATATNILAHESTFLAGFAAYVMNVVSYIVVTLLFYNLFRPVSAGISLLAAFFSLVGCAVQAAACLFDLGAIAALGGDQYLSVFTKEQLQALALTSLRLHGQGYAVGLIFFGCYCLLIGYLVFRSTFLPRVIGVLMMIAGVGWLTFLSPSLVHVLGAYARIPGIIGEGSLTLWLLVKGATAGASRT